MSTTHPGFIVVDDEEQAPQASPQSEEPRRKLSDMMVDEFQDILIKGVVQGVAAAMAQMNREKIFQPSQAHKSQPAPTGAMNRGLFTVGTILHGGVDIAETIMRGTVDIVTLGAAKRR